MRLVGRVDCGAAGYTAPLEQQRSHSGCASLSPTCSRASRWSGSRFFTCTTTHSPTRVLPPSCCGCGRRPAAAREAEPLRQRRRRRHAGPRLRLRRWGLPQAGQLTLGGNQVGDAGSAALAAAMENGARRLSSAVHHHQSDRRRGYKGLAAAAGHGMRSQSFRASSSAITIRSARRALRHSRTRLTPAGWRR